MLYAQPQCHLVINGHASRAIKQTRGVRQGDPLSPILFTLALETLHATLRKHQHLGLTVPNSTTRLTSGFFADDSLLFSPTIDCLTDQLKDVETYCNASGAKLNTNKSKIMPLYTDEPISDTTPLP